MRTWQITRRSCLRGCGRGSDCQWLCRGRAHRFASVRCQAVAARSNGFGQGGQQFELALKGMPMASVMSANTVEQRRAGTKPDDFRF
jgi:hypothetical protein